MLESEQAIAHQVLLDQLHAGCPHRIVVLSTKHGDETRQARAYLGAGCTRQGGAPEGLLTTVIWERLSIPTATPGSHWLGAVGTTHFA